MALQQVQYPSLGIVPLSLFLQNNNNNDPSRDIAPGDTFVKDVNLYIKNHLREYIKEKD